MSITRADLEELALEFGSASRQGHHQSCTVGTFDTCGNSYCVRRRDLLAEITGHLNKPGWVAIGRIKPVGPQPVAIKQEGDKFYIDVKPIAGYEPGELQRPPAGVATFTGEHPCGGCGGPYRFDTSIPSVIWNRVVRPLNWPETLCLTCIVQIFAQAGKSFTAELSGDGFDGLPIEVTVDGKHAQDAQALNEENNKLRCKLREVDPSAVDEFCRPELE